MSKINTKTESTEIESIYGDSTVERHKDVSGTDVDAKRALDTYSQGDSLAALHSLMPILLGTLPDPNYDEIQRILNVDGSETYEFYCDNNLGFVIDIVDPNGAFNVKITNRTLLALVDGSATFGLIDESGYVGQIGA